MFKLHKNVKKSFFLTDLEIVTPDPSNLVDGRQCRNILIT